MTHNDPGVCEVAFEKSPDLLLFLFDQEFSFEDNGFFQTDTGATPERCHFANTM